MSAPLVCFCSRGLCYVAGDTGRLRRVLECAQQHIHSSSQLYKLAQDAFKIATTPDGSKHMPALNAAFELGLQVGESLPFALNCLKLKLNQILIQLVTVIMVLTYH